MDVSSVPTGADPADLHSLVSRVAEGDEEAYEALFMSWSPKLVGYIHRRWNLDIEEAEATTQRAMLNVWRYARTYAGDAPKAAKAWLYTIADNEARRVIKSIIKIRKSVEQLSEQLELEHVHSGPGGGERSRVEVRQSEAERFQNYRMSLSSREREYITMAARGLPQTEIAKNMGIVPSRVSQLKTACLKKAKIFYRFQDKD